VSFGCETFFELLCDSETYSPTVIYNENLRVEIVELTIEKPE